MSRLIGIDLGTVRSRVAVFDGGAPRLILDAEGRPATPSVVAFAPAGPLVGEPALSDARGHPERVVFGIKRRLGVATDTPLLPDLEESLTPPLVRGADSATVVVSILLRHLRGLAERSLGETIEGAVVSVPSGFGWRRRRALREAARLAGFSSVRLVNEMSAAILHRALREPPAREPEYLAAYGLGGGCFGVTVLEGAEGILQVRASAGHARLGGDDLDAPLAAWLASELRATTGLDPWPHPRLRLYLRAAAEKARFDLANASETDVSLALPRWERGERARFSTRLSRARLDELTRDTLAHTVELSRRAVADAGLFDDQVDRVLLVGGTTRDFRVRGILRELFPGAVVGEVEPDACVALGTAVLAGMMSGGVDDLVLLDVLPHTLSLETSGGESVALVERCSTIPTRRRRRFTTTVDRQTTAVLHFLEGESDRAADNASLGRFEVRGLARANAGAPGLEVEVEVDVTGRVSAGIEEVGSGRRWAAALDADALSFDLSGSQPLVPVTVTTAPPLAPVVAAAAPRVDLAPGAACNLGILAAPGGFVPFVRRHQTLPVNAVGLFTTTAQTRSGVEVVLLTRVADTPAGRARRLARLALAGLQPASRDLHRIEITVSVDVDGGVTVTARDGATGLRQSLSLPSIEAALAASHEIETRVVPGGLALMGDTAPSGEPSAAEIERLRREEENRAFRSWHQERNVIEQIEAMVANVTRAIEALGERLGAEDRDWILEAVQKASATLARRRLGEGKPDELDDRLVEMQTAARLVGRGFMEP